MKKNPLTAVDMKDTGSMVPMDLVHTVFHFAMTQVEVVAKRLMAGPQTPEEEAALDGAIANAAQALGVAMTREQFLGMTRGTVTALMVSAMPGLQRLHDCIGQATAMMEAATQQAKAQGADGHAGRVVIHADPEAGMFMVRLDNSGLRGAKADASGNIVI